MQILSIFPECKIIVTSIEDGSISSSAEMDGLLATSGVLFRELVMPSHEHGVKVAVLDDLKESEHKELVCDALLTSHPSVVLAHRIADCLPIIIIDREQRLLLTLHAGWKGLLQNIVHVGVLTMQARYKSKPEKLFAWIGPSISKESFISEDVPVQASFGAWKNFMEIGADGKFHVDLVGFAQDALSRVGLKSEKIFVDGRDTFMESEIFFSHRRSRLSRNPLDDGRFVVGAYLV